VLNGTVTSELTATIDDLSLDNNHIHATVRNGYEEDFEAYGDEGAADAGANAEHACRCVGCPPTTDK
jgi:hypothetical protein